MKEKDLKHFNRKELLELLLEESRKNDLLKAQNEELIQKLSDRNIAIETAGSLAEAAVKITEIFETAQKTADLYLENVRRIGNEKE